MPLRRRWVVGTLAVLLGVGAAGPACAQGRGGGGGGMGGGMGGGGMGRGGPGTPAGPGSVGGASTPMSSPSLPGMRPDTASPPPAAGPGNQSTISTMRAGLQLGPPGRWWDDKSFAKSLKLRPDQQSRMDAIFEQNRSALLARYQGLQQAESQMEEISRSPNLDENTLFAGIDHVAQARADLEKATAHYLLQIRKEMDPGQIQRLEKHR